MVSDPALAPPLFVQLDEVMYYISRPACVIFLYGHM